MRDEAAVRQHDVEEIEAFLSTVVRTQQGPREAPQKGFVTPEAQAPRPNRESPDAGRRRHRRARAFRPPSRS